MLNKNTMNTIFSEIPVMRNVAIASIGSVITVGLAAAGVIFLRSRFCYLVENNESMRERN